MIVFNWPDECPKCGCREFYSSNTQSMSTLTNTRGDKLTKQTAFIHNRINFNCRDETCGASWVHELQGSDPYVFVHGIPKSPPMAVFAGDEQEAAQLVALHGSWSYYPLKALLRAGAERIRFLREQIDEAVVNVDDEGIRADSSSSSPIG